MTREEALEKFELESDANSSEIQQQYQELYNEFQMRITNAPTDHQRKLYRKKLEELEAAYVFLTGTSTADADSELPGTAPTADTAQPKSQPKTAGVLSKAQALKLLGLGEPFTKQVLDKAYQAKSKECEKGKENAIDEDIANVYENTLGKIKQAFELLKPLVQEPKPSVAPKPKAIQQPQAGKKSKSVVFVVGGLLVMVALLFVFRPWEPSIDPEIEKQFVVLKSQADLLAQQKNWEEAIKKYQEADKLMANQEVQDSISAIDKRVKIIAVENEDALWNNAKDKNTITSLQEYLIDYPNGRYVTEAKNKMAAIKIAELEKQKQEESKRKKEAAERKKKSGFKDKYAGSFVYVQGGSFNMGCTSEQETYEQGRKRCSDDGSHVHEVHLDSYYIGKYEVTQAQWETIMGTKPERNKCNTCPVNNVDVADIEKFIKKLNAKTGKSYRLPTEAEWEYSARGGNKSRGYRYSGSNNLGDVAWYSENSGLKIHPIGLKKPNELGIYDMIGNVEEWCNDWYEENYYYHSPRNNPKGPESAPYPPYQVHRGHAFYDRFCILANRGHQGRILTGSVRRGFRLALNL